MSLFRSFNRRARKSQWILLIWAQWPSKKISLLWNADVTEFWSNLYCRSVSLALKFGMFLLCFVQVLSIMVALRWIVQINSWILSDMPWSGIRIYIAYQKRRIEFRNVCLRFVRTANIKLSNLTGTTLRSAFEKDFIINTIKAKLYKTYWKYFWWPLQRYGINIKIRIHVWCENIWITFLMWFLSDFSRLKILAVIFPHGIDV